MKSLLFFSLLSSYIIFSAEQQTHELQTPPGANLQELCIDVIVANRINSKMLYPDLQLRIARKDLAKAQNHETERRSLLERLTEHEAYETFDAEFQDDPDHISHLFPTLHTRYMSVHATDATLKKCLVCLATKGITPGHSIRCLEQGSIHSVGIGALLSPVIFVTTVLCCLPMTDPILKGLLCFLTSGIVCHGLCKTTRSSCNRHTQHCYTYLTDPGGAPQPIVMEAYLEPEAATDSLD